MGQSYFIPKNRPSDYLLKLFCNSIQPAKRGFFNHKHPQFEIALFKSGSGTYCTKNKTYDIKPNDVFVFASNETHCITEISEGEQLSYTTIQFEPRYIWGVGSQSLSSENFRFCYNHHSRFQNRLPRGNVNTEKIKNLILQSEKEFYDENAEFELAIKLNLMNILLILIRSFDYAEEPDERNENFRIIANVLNFINENLTGELSLKDISAVAGMSPNYFSAVFKKINGITLWDYILAKRVELAQWMIIEADSKTMLDIAVSCGFNNTANFNKTFKKFTGLTPSRYKKEGCIF